MIFDPQANLPPQAVMKAFFQPSGYQQAIFDWVERDRGHAFVEAVAGSGKTTTLVECARRISGRGVFLAFNKHIKEELESRLAGTAMTVSTIHGMGWLAVKQWLGKKPVVDDGKYARLIDDAVAEAQNYGRNWPGWAVRKTDQELAAYWGSGEFNAKDFEKIVDLIRLTMQAPTVGNVSALCLEHGIDGDAEIMAALSPAILKRGRETVTESIDFCDMVWLPAAFPEFKPRRFGWVFVDEAQDLSAAQRAVVARCLGAGGRLLAVGDRRQAIYGFAGADARSVDALVADFAMKLLPLSVCYRCPTAHLALARELAPQIEARPGAPEGIVRSIQRGDLAEEAREGDLILCRLTAPLIGACLELIGAGIPARVKGRDVAASLVATMKRVVGARTGAMARFSEALERWRAAQIGKIPKDTRGERDPAQVQAVEDRAECLAVIYGRSRPQTVFAFEAAIKAIFSEERASVWLSTVHRAKGLEAGRVMILRPDKMPLARARGAALEQEWNLKYVALTRAKSELIFVHEGEASGEK